MKKLKKLNKKKYKKIKLFDVYKKTFTELITFWRPLALVLSVYALLYIILILGLNIIPSTQDLKDQVASYLGENIGSFLTATGLIIVSVSSSAQSDSTTLLQYFLFIVASLAFIFALRKLQQLKKVKVKEAYYLGNSNLIAVIVVTVLLIFCLVPAGLGSIVLATAFQYSATSLELTVVSIISGLLLFATIYLLAVWWPAFYISSLPGTTPLASFKSARQITKGNRFKIIGIISFSVLMMFLTFFSVLIPIAMLLPTIIPILAFIMLLIYFAILHTILFTIYRNLIDETS